MSRVSSAKLKKTKKITYLFKLQIEVMHLPFAYIFKTRFTEKMRISIP